MKQASIQHPTSPPQKKKSWNHAVLFNFLTVCDVIFYKLRKTNAVTF